MSDAANRLRRGKEAVARGQLSFDRTEARDKMRKFRLADPHFYVLQFVRAASVLGARRVEFELDARHMTCTFDKSLQTDAFDDFWGAVFEARHTPMQRALHNIALGVGSAQALKPREIRVQSGAREIVFTDDGEMVRDCLTDSPGTRIEMTEKFRFGHLIEYFTDHAEVAALRDHCRHAQILVVVDGECVQSAVGEHRTEFESRDEQGFVALRASNPSSFGTTFHFLRDDVLVRTHNVAAQLRPAVGAVNSRLLRTDLSGLELAGDETVDQLLYDKLFAAYHNSLLQWLKASGTQGDLLRVGMAVFHHIAKLRRMGIMPPPATRALVDWWSTQPLFTSADLDEAHIISAAQAQHEGVMLYSRRRFSIEKLSEYSHVLFVDTRELSALMQQLRDGGWATRDVTLKLAEAADAGRNRDVWEKQPPRETPHSPVVRTVTAGETTGVLFAPFTPPGTVEQLQCEFTTYSEGRRLLRRLMQLPIGIQMDGSLTPDPMYRDVVRDLQFRRLAKALVGQVPYYVRDVLKYVITPPVHPGQRTAGMQLLQAYLSGALAQALADAFDMAVADIAGELLEVATEVNRLTLLERLGEIADLPLFRPMRGEPRSLRELYMQEQPPVVLGHRMLVVEETGALLAQKGYDVFRAGPAEAETLRQLRPDSRGESFVAFVMSEARFMARPEFEPPPLQTLATAAHRWVLPEGAFRIDAELLGDGDQCEVLFIYRDRVLARRSWPSFAGRFRVLVRSDDLTPQDDFQDIADTVLVDQAYQGCQSLTRGALSSWCMDARTAERLTPSEFRLLWKVTTAWAKEKPHALTVSVWRWGSGWERAVMSLVQLRELVEDDGGVAHVHRGQDEPPTGADRGAVIVRAPADANIEDLLTARVVEAGGRTGEAARIRFMSEPLVAPEIRGALFTWRGELDELQLVVGLMRDATLQIFGHKNVIDVLWEGRRLEQIPEWVPFGDFRTLVHGDSIAPDPEFTFVRSGRGDAIRVAQLGVVRLLEEACGDLAGSGVGELGEREPLRQGLLHILASCQRRKPAAPFDVGPLLRRTPLYQTTSGERLSFDELEELAFEGAIGFVSEPSPRRALMIDERDVDLVTESFAEHYWLLPLDALDAVVDDGDGEAAASAGDMREEAVPKPDPHEVLLDGVRRLLQQARGESEVLPQSVLRGMQWADALVAVCDVQLDGLRLNDGHPLVEFCERDPSDTTRMRFLASVVGSSVNRQLRVFTDAHELELQAALIAASNAR